MKVRDFDPKLSPQNQLDIYVLSDTLGVLVRLSQAQKCLQINPKPFHSIIINFKNFVFSGFF